VTRQELVDAMQRVVARHTDADTTPEPARDLDLSWVPQLGTVFFSIAILLIAVGIAFGVAAWIRRSNRQKQGGQREAARGVGESVSVNAEPSTFDRINTQLDNGPISEIPSMLYAYLVTYLTSHGIVQRGEYKTHRTLLRALNGNKSVSPVVVRVGETAERITFAHGQTSNEECVELRDAVAMLTGEPHAK
jgi:hypothetical protein